MKRLEEAFLQAGRWVKRNARPLEAARWEYVFAGGTRERVLEMLEAYQNPDGGFGHGIEPDFWLPASSPMSSWAAARILLEVEAGPDTPMVQALVDYLCRVQDPTGLWPAVLPENNHFPHAPWWHWEEGVEERWMFNPSVELAAYLIHWSCPGSTAADAGWKTVGLALNRLIDCTEMDMHEIANYLKFTELMGPRVMELQERTGHLLPDVERKLTELVITAVETDPSQWDQGYRALPLTFVQGPDSFLCEALGDLVQKNLNFYAEQVDEKGLWPVTWQWSAYSSEFEVAKRHWQGIIALERYRILRAFAWF
ncbi:MAG: hypothetical protein GX030_10310 [Firmicutes bacterium]|nr:hypothetical protein [Bacillota bacterium]